MGSLTIGVSYSCNAMHSCVVIVLLGIVCTCGDLAYSCGGSPYYNEI